MFGVSQSTIEFIKRSKLEPLLFVNGFATAVRQVAIQQLLQDKLCIEKYHEDRDYCHYLSKQPETEEKDDILADVAQYLTYKEFIVIIPYIVSALFIGIWCDRFPNGKRYCMLSCSFAQFTETFLLLMNAINFYASPWLTILSFLPASFFGNDFGLFTAVYGYISTNIKPSERALRFITIAIVRNASQSLGFFVGGQIIRAAHPIISSEQIQNYAGTYVVSCVCSLFNIGWTYVFIKPPKPTDLLDEIMKGDEHDKYSDTTSTHSFEASMNLTNIPLNISQEELIPAEDNEDGENEVQPVGFLAKLIDLISLKNLRKIWITSTKVRPGTVRLRMWLVVITINLILLPDFGKNAVIYPMVEKVYEWDSTAYSNLVTLRYLIQIVIVTLALPFLFKFFPVNDMQTAMIGCVSAVIGDVLIGSITKPLGIYMWATVSSLNGYAGSGCRAYISKLLPKNEVSQIFSVTLTVEALCLALGTFLFSELFEKTIHSYPTFVFHFMGIIYTVALGSLVYIDLTTPYDKNSRARASSKARIHPLQSVDLGVQRHSLRNSMTNRMRNSMRNSMQVQELEVPQVTNGISNGSNEVKVLTSNEENK